MLKIVPEKPKYRKPYTDPYGHAWPKVAAYLYKSKIGCYGGHSQVTIDNSNNNSEVHVKLVFHDLKSQFPVREFFIPAFGKFILPKVAQGFYDIRYRDLISGELLKSQGFRLEESREEGGIRYSSITMTLYTVINGNMSTYPISENEF